MLDLMVTLEVVDTVMLRDDDDAVVEWVKLLLGFSLAERVLCARL